MVVIYDVVLNDSTIGLLPIHVKIYITRWEPFMNKFEIIYHLMRIAVAEYVFVRFLIDSINILDIKPSLF